MAKNRAHSWPDSGVAGNLASTRTFGPIPVQGDRLALEASWTGTPTGVFSLETTFDGTTWREIPGAAPEFTANSQTQPGGADGSAIWIWSNVPGQMVRIRYTATSGTGVLTLRGTWGD